ncbi:MAG: hypothetical protein KC443_15165, partial [Anaerolineales bacterium]|nr:hypothetical protein [Anaerolineales bacterium]
MSTRPSLAIYLFGAPRIEVNGRSVHLSTRKATALLAYLAVSDTWSSRDTLIGLLWAELPQQRAKAALRSALSVARQALDGCWLQTENDQIRLEPGYTCDVQQFRQSLKTNPDQAVTLYQGEFMAGFYLRQQASDSFDDWKRRQDEDLRHELDMTLAQLAAAYAQRGEWETAVAHTRRRLQLDPLHEPAHQQLIELYLAANQPAAALRHYEKLSELLDAELGVTPAPEIERLLQRLPAPGTAAAPPRTNLPTHDAHTPFIGRAAELAHIEQQLQDAGCRLLTITGAG